MSIRISDISVAILDGNEFCCDAFRVLLEHTPGFTCAGVWNNAADAARALPLRSADVFLLDLQLPGKGALDLMARLPALAPDMAVIVMVDCPGDRCSVQKPIRCCDQCAARPILQQIVTVPHATSDDCLQLALKMGARGALRKRRPFRIIAEAIRAVSAGRIWMELPTARRLAQQYLGSLHPNSAPARTGLDRLTQREREVAALVAQGRSNREICDELSLGYSTVKNYVSSILEKLDLRDRTQIALYAMDRASVAVEA